MLYLTRSALPFLVAVLWPGASIGAVAGQPGGVGPHEAAPAQAVLSGTDAWKALIGNTISGTTPDGPYAEYFTPDGTVVHLDRDGTDRGRWALKEASVCFVFPDASDEQECRSPKVEGTHGAFVDIDGTSYPFDIRPGNPEHL